MSRSRALVLALCAVAALLVPAGALAAPAAKAKPVVLVKTFQHSTFGKVLAVKGGKEAGKPLYYWRKEIRDGTECTGSCAVAWPPLLVPKGRKVKAKVAGIKGTFGVTTRPDGKRQLTHNGRPLYSYAHERPGQVLCDDVDEGFVIGRV
ncbi:MAG: hypothetical protein R3C15_16130 [Thermoleophilia bacterium]